MNGDGQAGQGGAAPGGRLHTRRADEMSAAVLHQPTAPGRVQMTDSAVVHLALANDAENVALVRHVVGGVADSVGMSERLAADVKTAVSEACGNVVLHAYGNAPGPMLVSLGVKRSGMTVVVRDRGGGIRPRREREQGRVLGVGLSLIQALSDSTELRGGKQGTQVRMSFHPEHRGDLKAPGALAEELLEDEPQDPAGEAIVAVSSRALAGAALGATVAVLAARASFSVDRLSDAQLLTDTIAAHADGVVRGTYLMLGVESAERRLDLRLGPLAPGGVSRLLAATALGNIRPLEVLADELATEPAGEHEYLRLRLTA